MSRSTFPGLSERDVEQWIARRAASKDLVLSHDVPKYLVGAVGTKLKELDLTLDRIDLFLGVSETSPRKVGMEAVRQVVSDTRIRTIFELVDALSARELARSLSYLDRMLHFGESPVGVVMMVARQFRILQLVREGSMRGMPDRDLARFAGCPSFKLRDMRAAARRFSGERLIQIHDEICATDHALKSSRLADRIHVERFSRSFPDPSPTRRRPRNPQSPERGKRRSARTRGRSASVTNALPKPATAPR